MSDAAQLMDRMYRRQRHIYDLSRKFYLLGRDEAIARLRPAPAPPQSGLRTRLASPGQGCGTIQSDPKRPPSGPDLL